MVLRPAATARRIDTGRQQVLAGNPGTHGERISGREAPDRKPLTGRRGWTLMLARVESQWPAKKMSRTSRAA
jgi:hypothetical protein